MRHILVSASLLLIAISSYGQTDSSQPRSCTLKLSQTPSVRGVRLDMTLDELLALFPGSSENAEIKEHLSMSEGYSNFGEATFNVTPSNYSTRERFGGIANYYVHLFDRRIVGLSVYYERFPKGARWRNADDLIQRFSDSLRLPGPKEWLPDPNNERKKLQCDGFEVAVVAGETATIFFHHENWTKIQKERRDAFEEQKRREFKP